MELSSASWARFVIRHMVRGSTGVLNFEDRCLAVVHIIARSQTVGMSRLFESRYLPYDSNTGMYVLWKFKLLHSILNANIATSHRRLYSTILAEFPWYTEAIALKPDSLLAHCEKLPTFKESILFLQ